MIAVGVPWWGRLSAVLAPVLLIGGWTVAAALQPQGFSPISATISELAGGDALHRWVMSAAIAGTGVCHVVTALALHPASRPGRQVLAVGGAATVLVAAFPLPAGGGSSVAHSSVAVVAFAALSVWGIPARRYGSGVPWGLRSAVALRAALVLSSLTLLFFATSLLGAVGVGLTERLAAGAQALWPLVVVASVRRR